MTTENTATTWRDLCDELTPKQVSMLAGDEQDTDLFDADALLLMARDCAAQNVGELVYGADWWND
jgi:hypothetical protein